MSCVFYWIPIIVSLENPEDGPQTDSVCRPSAQEWTNRTPISHERTNVHFLVLPGSLFSITEITEYTHFSRMQTLAEFEYQSD